jgi:hypothetical protein
MTKPRGRQKKRRPGTSAASPADRVVLGGLMYRGMLDALRKGGLDLDADTVRVSLHDDRPVGRVQFTPAGEPRVLGTVLRVDDARGEVDVLLRPSPEQLDGLGPVVRAARSAVIRRDVQDIDPAVGPRSQVVVGATVELRGLRIPGVAFSEGDEVGFGVGGAA